jgi:hypothetical protein
MAKEQYQPPATRQHQETLNAESQALVAALASAIRSSTSDRNPPSEAAVDAAAEYAEIKRALKTFFEQPVA